MFVIVGLGNPGPEYAKTRHNTGWLALDRIVGRLADGQWSEDEKIKALKLRAKVGRERVLLVKPLTFMNQSGESVKRLLGSKKQLERLAVIHDDLDLPLGKVKMSFNRGPAGHRGVSSVIKAAGSEGFIRFRVGISRTVGRGKVRKPRGEKAVSDFILGQFEPKELLILKKEADKISQAIEMVIKEGREKTMSQFNSR